MLICSKDEYHIFDIMYFRFNSKPKSIRSIVCNNCFYKFVTDNIEEIFYDDNGDILDSQR